MAQINKVQSVKKYNFGITYVDGDNRVVGMHTITLAGPSFTKAAMDVEAWAVGEQDWYGAVDFVMEMI